MKFMPKGALKRFLSRTRFRSRMRHVAGTLPRNGKPTAILIGFAAWKHFMVDYLQDHNVVFFGNSPAIDPRSFDAILDFPEPEVFAWSYQFPPELQEFCAANGLALTFVEDGFLRSVGLGVERSRPLSLVFDRKSMHFDRARPSQLEELLQSVDLSADTELLDVAERLQVLIASRGLSKYVLAGTRARIADLGLSPSREKILVLGQVDDDLSIRYGASRPWTSNQLVKFVRDHHPVAEILYRPHPHSLASPKPHYSKPDEVASLCHVVGPEFPLHDCIAVADSVYTITSLAGFEAAVHGKHVITMGSPFYSGWGFTEDRDPVSRRTRNRTATEVLAIAYGIYPRYFDPVTGERIGLGKALDQFLHSARDLLTR